MREYLKGWNFIRLLRLALGVIIFIQGLQANEWLFMLVGGVFAALALFNVSTCALSGSACSTPLKTNDKKKIENITYEEIH